MKYRVPTNIEDLDRAVDELLASPLEGTVPETREQVRGVSRMLPHMLREKEIREIILNLDPKAPLEDDRLLDLRRKNERGKLMLAEYMYQGTQNTFLYVARECQNPDFLDEFRDPVPLQQQLESTLFEISNGAILRVLHTWGD